MTDHPSIRVHEFIAHAATCTHLDPATGRALLAMLTAHTRHHRPATVPCPAGRCRHITPAPSDRSRADWEHTHPLYEVEQPWGEMVDLRRVCPAEVTITVCVGCCEIAHDVVLWPCDEHELLDEAFDKR